MIKITYLSLAILIILFCSMMPAYSDQSRQKEFVKRINAVNQIIDQASNTNSLWRETKNLSNTAKKYAAANNYALANEILTEAELQANLGIQQALDQQDINKLIPFYLQH